MSTLKSVLFTLFIFTTLLSGATNKERPVDLANPLIDTHKPVLGGCIGPFSLAGRLFGMTEIMIATFTEPETAHLLLKKCAQFILNYCRAIKDTGVNGIVMAEPAADMDYVEIKRTNKPAAGPFKLVKEGRNTFKVW